METRMALLITQRTVLVIAIIAFMPTMIRTQSEIPENKVIVDIRPVFLRGFDGMLQCRFNGAPLAVFWLKGADLATGTNLVTWYPPPRVVSGSGYVSGKYNLTEDFSLVIHNVTDDDAGRYICRISNFNGFILRNYTEATVQTPPQAPFPTIDQCPTGADGRGTEPCILTQETGANSTELTCRTMGATRGVVSLSWTLGGRTFPRQAPQRSTNPDGVTEDVMVAINAKPSADHYVCVATLPATTRRQSTMSVTLNTAQIVTTIEAITTKNVTVFPPAKPINKHETVIIISTVCVLSVIILIIILAVFIRRGRKGHYKRLNSDQRYNEGPVSYLELWELVEMCIIFEADGIVNKLVGPERESEHHLERSQADLYSELCEWKDKCTGDVRTRLYAAIEDPKKIKDIRALTDKMVSLDDHDLEHICWHVQGCKKTVKPVLRALYPRIENITKFPGDAQTSGNSRSDVIKNDLQLMKTWKEKSMSPNPEKEGETVKIRQPTSRGKLQTGQDAGDRYERTPMYSAGSEDVDLGAKTLPPNQMVQACLALEEAGRWANESDKLVYHQLAKTFFQIQDEYKSELKDKVCKEFALSITERHCQRLGNTLKLSADAIAIRNEEDLEMFGTDVMLKAWMLDQKCSNYEIRRRLRQAAEQCNRQDIADNFISKEQSEVMTSTTKLPACVTITNEKQSLGASASGSKDALGNGASSKPVPQSSHGDLEETATIVAQPAANTTESEVGFVSAISRDELDRIGRYAGPAVLLAFCKKYEVTEVPEQQSPEGKELPFVTKIINVLKPTLDSEHKRNKTKETDTPRENLRQFLQNEQPRYAYLLAKKKPDDIFNIELVDLAFRLIMADVYPFAKALNISDQVLTQYRRNLGPHNLRHGTIKIMLQVTTDYLSKIVTVIANKDPRLEMVKALKQAGYSEEARALYFGCEIGLGDMVEVENRVDKAQLAKQLGVSDDVKKSGSDNQGKDGTLHQSVLFRWRDTVRSSTFNHRLVLADALFSMDEEQLALDIISGVYRKRAIDNPVSERLAATIPEEGLLTLSNVLGQKVKNGQKCQDVITAWVNEKKLSKFFSKSPTKLSNELLGAGFYAFAHEVMAGAWKEDKKAGQKEGTKNGKAANEELHQEGVPINEQGEQEGKEKKEGKGKATSGATPVENTGKEGEKKDKEKVEGMEKATNDDTPVKHTGKEGTSQNRQKMNSPGKEAKDTNNVVAEISEEDNPSTKKKGAWKEDKKAGQKEGTKNGTAATKGPHQEGIPINEPGGINSEDKKPSGKEVTATNNVVAETSEEGNHITNEKGAKHVDEYDKASKEKASTNENGTDGKQNSLDDDHDDFEHVYMDDLQQEMDRDEAAKSNKNTTVHVDTKKQGNTPKGSDERQRDDCSETPITEPAKLDYWGEPIDNSQHMDPAAMSRAQAFI